MTKPILVAALYKFVNLPDYLERQQPLLEFCLRHNILGTILLASEGINGTISGNEQDIHAVIKYLRDDAHFSDLSYKESYADQQPFYRMKVKLKKEIVTMGVVGIDPQQSVGTYVKPEDWNTLISDPDVTVIDTRNRYEVAIGQFKGAVNPNTTNFRELPTWLDQHVPEKQHTKIAMYCTGGIRCEKSTAYLKEQGFDQVYHLQGGILKYLETVPEEQSLWEGECFVFDQRVSVGHGLALGHYDQCHACRHPISEEDKSSPHYEEGISCPLCYDQSNEHQKQRFAERQRQMEIAARRNSSHIGQDLSKKS